MMNEKRAMEIIDGLINVLGCITDADMLLDMCRKAGMTDEELETFGITPE